MSSFSPFCPVDIRVLPRVEGQAAIQAMLAGRAHQLLVLAPRHLCAGLSLAAFFAALQGDGHAVHLFTELPSNPSVDDLAMVLRRLRTQGFQPSRILAIGGGSCLDLAKGISALWHLPVAQTATPQAVREAIHAKAYQEEHSFVDWVAMPTTSGTGSEVTHWATIWDTQKGQKLSMDCPELLAKAAVLIPEWTVGMPASLTLATGLDAVSHAMEAFWARSRTPLSQSLALSAIETARRVLPKVLRQPSDISLRQDMCMASLLAGLAFSLTRTTACHSISYPLTMQCGVPHGYAAALTLGEVLRRNREVVPEVSRIEALFEEDGGVKAWLSSVSGGVQPLALSAFGITEYQLPTIVSMTFTQGRMDNNPIAFSPQEVLEILCACF